MNLSARIGNLERKTATTDSAIKILIYRTDGAESLPEKLIIRDRNAEPGESKIIYRAPDESESAFLARVDDR